jgi:hypothetical protein
VSPTNSSNKAAIGLRLARDLIGTFAECAYVVRDGSRPESLDAVAENWAELPGVAAQRDFIAIDESGDFDGNAGGVNDTFLVGVAVHFDAGNYARLARMFEPWRHIVHESNEVKAASGRLKGDQEDDFLAAVGALASSGVCAVSIGVVDKISHREDTYLTDLRDKPDIRHDFHMGLLREHLRVFRPRSTQLRLLIDQYGLDPMAENGYRRAINRLLEEAELGGVHARVDFLDSLTVETIQLADLVAGTVRKMFRGAELPDDLRTLARSFLLCDLTDRTRR